MKWNDEKYECLKFWRIERVKKCEEMSEECKLLMILVWNIFDLE